MRLTYTRERGAGWARAAAYAGGFVVLLWVIEFVDYVLGNSLDDEGVRPRDDEGLIGIVFAPLLHAGWDHLIANSLPLLVLGFPRLPLRYRPSSRRDRGDLGRRRAGHLADRP